MINLNKPETFTMDAVKELIASKDDSQRRQLRVAEDGTVYLSDVIGNLELDGVRFALATWLQGNDYVGANAARDHSWVRSVHDTVKYHWEKGTRGVTDEMV
ncbi:MULTISPECIES: hypothetical protein [Bradyrhizobium]|uniref:hypothetical protein n=1 Tax=Bradyrhizobium TaxID=374 RepID=UPI00155ECD2E|nr:MULTISPECIES: hypothetical protein [Bradyrhizobium]MDD1522126.1 hypothetical protein [Bradyrhizobium sp. WBAH30]MDD1541446.1 hypothetical protein [Bradyrhizobium sp. WBAH41]MDD1556930.1 hypothetical protein [Bradyrhizobium sp. WBAH23]MDD1564731.1 hypothetical protein [Bradyrhizobium sp. WBAH33]MDD1589716.1 hypothetical protein [Bradyrhizobium sp. WBAH42]